MWAMTGSDAMSPVAYPMEPVIRRVTRADAGAARALRLEMLADRPLAFIETLAEAAAQPHAEFAEQLAERASGQTYAQFVADPGGEPGRLAGTASGVAPRGSHGATLVFTVYVSPPWRGTGLVGRMVEAVADWSRAAGRHTLVLEVVAGNDQAVRAYRRLGFLDTGRRSRHPTAPVLSQIIMARPA